MMNPLAVSCDLAADNTIGIRVLDRPTNPINLTILAQLDLKCAGRWAIMRTGTMENRLIHGTWCAADQLQKTFRLLEAFEFYSPPKGVSNPHL
jgi:hypothetical protein